MRIAVADYDGTVKVFRKPMDPENIPTIRKWREKGNRFGLATGRDLRLASWEIREYDIPVDFLICLNGATIFDQDGRLLQSTVIDDDLVPAILQHPAGMASHQYQILGPEMNRFFRRGRNLYERFPFPRIQIDFATALTCRNIGLINFAYDTAAEATVWAKQVNDDFGGRVVAHDTTFMVDVIRPDVDKAVAIADVIRTRGWEGAEVYTIGDSSNDLGMLRRYHGCCVPNATADVKAAAKREYPGLAAMLNDLM